MKKKKKKSVSSSNMLQFKWFFIFMTVIVLILEFKFGETLMCFTACQILNFGIPQFSYIAEFEFEKSSSNLKPAINKSPKTATLRATF